LLFFGTIRFLRSWWHILVLLPFCAEQSPFLLKGRQVVAWLGRYRARFAAAAGSSLAGLTSLNALSFGLILLFSLLGQLQLTLELLNALSFRRFLRGCCTRRIIGLAGLVLAQELTIQAGIAVSSSTLPFLFQPSLGVLLFCCTFLFLQLPLTLFLVPASALLFHLTALFLP
jgi:hypothetical protein